MVHTSRQDARGRYIRYSLGFILGPVVGGAVSQLVAGEAGWLAGYRAAFVIAGLSEAACVALALPMLLRLRRSLRT